MSEKKIAPKSTAGLLGEHHADQGQNHRDGDVHGIVRRLPCPQSCDAERDKLAGGRRLFGIRQSGDGAPYRRKDKAQSAASTHHRYDPAMLT